MTKDFFTIRSMTAFGQGEALFKEGRFLVVLQSCNRRFLEVNISAPRFLISLENQVREKIASCVTRGQVSCNISCQTEESFVSVKPNLTLAAQLKLGWELISREVGISEPFTLSLIAHEKELFQIEERTEEVSLYQKTLFAALENAIDHLLEEKCREGEKLKKDLLERQKTLFDLVKEIEKSAPRATTKQRERLQQRVDELFAGSENEERVLREIVLFAERVDITEELVRFKIHLEHLGSVLAEKNAATKGKKLDFILQELLRETNTIGAKASDVVVSSSVIEMKSELEKMKEQVQNIE
ncbi:MAG: YicC/YloC family endoribonuclease [Chlamydiales bacterium]